MLQNDQLISLPRKINFSVPMQHTNGPIAQCSSDLVTVVMFIKIYNKKLLLIRTKNRDLFFSEYFV